jgi:uncharacterized protein YgiB involved in biofilm formation
MQKDSEQPESAGAVSSTRLLGDTVQWESQSGGYYGKVKRGVIVQVVKAGEVPDPGTMRVIGAGFGMSRKHESYLVKVGNVAYWPRVNHLRVVSPNAPGEPPAREKEKA